MASFLRACRIPSHGEWPAARYSPEGLAHQRICRSIPKNLTRKSRIAINLHREEIAADFLGWRGVVEDGRCDIFVCGRRLFFQANQYAQLIDVEPLIQLAQHRARRPRELIEGVRLPRLCGFDFVEPIEQPVVLFPDCEMNGGLAL